MNAVFAFLILGLFWYQYHKCFQYSLKCWIGYLRVCKSCTDPIPCNLSAPKWDPTTSPYTTITFTQGSILLLDIGLVLGIVWFASSGQNPYWKVKKMVAEHLSVSCSSVCINSHILRHSCYMQVSGPMLKQMPSPGGSVGGVVGSVGGVGGVGGGVFPPQISPQQLAMLSNIYPHMQQFHLVGD